jgi:hypothetical protein
MRRNLRLLRWVVLCALLALVATSNSIASGGNSASAQLCQQGGWAQLVRSSDASTFTDEGDCVSHGARQGTYSQLQVQAGCLRLGRSYDFCITMSAFGLLPGSLVSTFIDLGSLGSASSFETVPADGALPLHVEVGLTCDGAPPVTFRFDAYAVGTTVGGATVTSRRVAGEVSICG